MNCVVCNKEIVMFGQPNPTFLPESKYWSYEEDGTIRPYCSCACGLEEYTHNLAEKESPTSES